MPSNKTSGSREDRRHPSFSWNPALRIAPALVRDPTAFAAAMDNPRYPRSSAWCPGWAFHNSMGPINLWGTEALSRRLALRPGARVLDLGCGAASSSIFLAMEFGVEVWATDLWIDPEDNRRRIEGAGMAAQVFPHRAEARQLPFEAGFFDAVVSIDAYHYFGTEVRYLSYLSQFVREGGVIGIVVPGNAVDPDDPAAVRLDPSLEVQFGADWFTFRSAAWWRRHWSYTSCVDVEYAGMVDGGMDDWHRWVDATIAAYGSHPGIELNDRMLADPAGRSLGFCMAVARRNDRPGITLGLGEFENRLA